LVVVKDVKNLRQKSAVFEGRFLTHMLQSKNTGKRKKNRKTRETDRLTERENNKQERTIDMLRLKDKREFFAVR
jgi:hypothetical protein